LLSCEQWPSRYADLHHVSDRVRCWHKGSRGTSSLTVADKDKATSPTME
jgi:hypothetical protein